MDNEHADTHASRDWSETFFDQFYLDYGLAVIDPARTNAEAAFFMEHLQLNRGRRVMDQCCGIGRISMPLAEQGVSVVGVDRSELYIRHAREQAGDAGVDAVFHHADARQFRLEEQADAGVSR